MKKTSKAVGLVAAVVVAAAVAIPSFSPESDHSRSLGSAETRWGTVYTPGLNDGEGNAVTVAELATLAEGGTGITSHDALTPESRAAENAHPVSAITGLSDMLRPATSASAGLMTAGDKSKLDSLDNLGAAYLPTAGGSMTGTLTLAADPTDDLDAATKRYVDDAVALSYQAPPDGIPASDLSPDVQESVAKAGTALQEESDPLYSVDAAGIARKTDIPDVSGKADKAVPSAANNVALLDAGGNLVDSGQPFPAGGGGAAGITSWNGQAGDVTFAESDPIFAAARSEFATKAVPAAAGNLAALDASGNLIDSGGAAPSVPSLATTAPPAVGTASAVGTSQQAARADHTHAGATGGGASSDNGALIVGAYINKTGTITGQYPANAITVTYYTTGQYVVKLNSPYSTKYYILSGSAVSTDQGVRCIVTPSGFFPNITELNFRGYKAADATTSAASPLFITVMLVKK